MAKITYEGKVYEALGEEVALDALIRGGASVAFSCRKGSCHTCVLRAVEGDVPDCTRYGLAPSLVETGHFLPCVSSLSGPLSLGPPDLSQRWLSAVVAGKRQLGPEVFELQLELETLIAWRPGQHVDVRRPDGLARSYSITSIDEEDYFMCLQVKRVADGQLSRWLCDEVSEGDMLSLRGPLGACVYDEAMASRALLLIGTGSGIGALHGIARDALKRGHQGRIDVYHGAREASGLYLDDAWRALEAAHPQVRYTGCVSGSDPVFGAAAGRVTQVAFEDHPELEGRVVYLCGNPDMVYEARYHAILGGVSRAAIWADPYEPAHPYMPQDSAKLAMIAPDLELWRGLGDGALLRLILEDFYAEVYEDARLAPFFHNVTRERAIDKQYAFLCDVISGSREYFGLRPFNAHHWMVISDELFDYREAMIERVARARGLEERLLSRWMALHERFRRELVKPVARGLIVDGREREQPDFSVETLDSGTLCDGCEAEMSPGDRGRLHHRTGKLFCLGCDAASAVNEVGAPS